MRAKRLADRDPYVFFPDWMPVNCDNAISMQVLLSRRENLDPADFRRFWQDVHGPLAARLPGLDYYRQIHVEPDPGWWPVASTVNVEPAESDRIDGIADMSFASAEQMMAYGKWAHYTREDEQNLFRRSVRYLADPLLPGRCAGEDDEPEKVSAAESLRLLVLVRRQTAASREGFDSFIARLAACLAGGEGIRRAKVLRFRERDNTRNHELSQNVDHDTPSHRQYDASIEAAFDDAFAARRFFSTAGFSTCIAEQASWFKDLHVYRIIDAPIMVAGARMTLSGLRGVSTARLVARAGAVNHLYVDVARMFCGPSSDRLPAFLYSREELAG